jgi:ABC-type glutathione transport system ATPase component
MRPEHSDDATQSYFRALDFQIIVSSTEEMLDYLQAVSIQSEPKITRSTQAIIRELFEYNNIPSAGTVPLRPIVDFISGSPPEWSDIYSDRIPQVSHLRSVRNSISSGENVVIIGLPASGKTTLLMQAAATSTDSSHKLILHSITPEKAELLVRTLAGEKCLVFIDNFTAPLMRSSIFHQLRTSSA